MPLILPEHLPAIELLKRENIFVMCGGSQVTSLKGNGMRALHIVILNLMPFKEVTETDFVRILSSSPLRIEITFMKLNSHVPHHTSIEHMNRFYMDFDSLSGQNFDGMIITGAPVELLAYEDVTYWGELTRIFNWSKTHVNSTLYICWAAQAGLFYHYGIPKYPLGKKMFGIFRQYPVDTSLPIFRGFDDFFNMPHSRHTEIRRQDIVTNRKLSLIAESTQSGVSMIMAREGREFFITGHMEYAPETLDKEFRRDKDRSDVNMPYNYYLDDNPANPPVVTWRAHANLMFNNWINYYVSR